MLISNLIMKAKLSLTVGPKELNVSLYKNCVRFEISETYTREAYVEITGEEPKDSDDLDHREVFLLDGKNNLSVLISYLAECLKEI